MVFVLAGRRAARGWQDLALRLDLQLFAVPITHGNFLEAWLPTGIRLLVVVIFEEVFERSVLATSLPEALICEDNLKWLWWSYRR